MIFCLHDSDGTDFDFLTGDDTKEYEFSLAGSDKGVN